MRYSTLLLAALLFFTDMKGQQLHPTFVGAASWRKAPKQSAPELLPVSVTIYPADKEVVHNTPATIHQRIIDPGTKTLRSGATVPLQQQLRISGKKLPEPRIIPAPPLQTRDNISYNISYTDKKHGFPADVVLDITEDDEHNIWIASEKGLIRYDGYQYHLYEIPLTITEVTERSLAYDKQKRLWMASESGIVFIRNDSVFSLQSSEIDLSVVACLTVTIDQFQRVWVSTKQNGALCIEGTSMKVYDKRCGLPDNYIKSTFIDKKGNLYLACNTFGIVLIEPDRIRSFFGPNKTSNHISILSFYEDNDGIWAGSFFAGILRLGTKDTLQYSPSGKFDERVFDIQKAPGGIWFACYSTGLAYFDKKEFFILNETNGLLNDRAYKIFEDSFQNLWVDNVSGISRVNENCLYLQNFSNPAIGSVTTILPDKIRGGNWITTYGKNLIFQTEKEASIYSYKTPTDGHYFSYTNAGLLDKKGNVWVGSFGKGIASFNKGLFTLYQYSSFGDYSIIEAIKSDAENNIWFCPTRFGIIMYDQKQFLHFTKASGLLSNDVIRLFSDANKNPQWSFADGFQRYVNKSVETLYLNDKLFDDRVNAVLELDANTALWGTNKNGLLIVQNEKVYRLNTAAGLGSDNIRSLIRDTTGRIWLSTERTIESFVLNNLSAQDHRIYNESNGSYILDAGNVFLDSMGFPYWAAGEKRIVFNKALLQPKAEPIFSFKEILLNDKTLSSDGKLVLYSNDKLELNYRTIYWGRENNLKLSYLLISNSNDTTERGVQNIGSIIIRDVLPGKYRLILKGTDNRGIYYSPAVNIQVNNFWYNTWLFRFCIVAFVIAIIVMYFKRRARVQQLINEQLEKKVTEQTAIIENEKKTLLQSYQTIELQNKEKDVLIDEINHRVKNNLEFIAAMLEMQINNQYSTEALQALLGTNRRIKAMSLVHELLYSEKDRKGLSISAYIFELVNNLREMAIDDANPINIELDIEDVVLDSKTVLPLGMIISELVSNSFKHAFTDVPDPTVSILLKHDVETDIFCLVVSDNGNGYQQTENEKSGRLGTRLVDIFSRQLQGTYTSNTNGHFKYQLQFNTIDT
jgi:two-component sensor histidine kinase/ligand-binding sensor domain-containing protein